MTGNDPYSRPAAAAETLGEHAADNGRFLDKRILLTAEPEILRTPNGSACLRGALYLIPRICRNVHVYLPVGCERTERQCRDIASRIQFGAPIVFTPEVCWDLYDAILSIGARARRDLPWTVINSDGWLARVSSGSTDLDYNTSKANPIGALAAASLGVAETFKRLLNVDPSRGPLLDSVTFSLYSYRCDDSEPGPDMPPQINVDLLMVGVGAIGTAATYLLSQLPLLGAISVVDPETFSDENLGTCLSIGPSDVGLYKADIAVRSLAGLLDARAFREDVVTFRRHRVMTFPTPALFSMGRTTHLHDGRFRICGQMSS